MSLTDWIGCVLTWNMASHVHFPVSNGLADSSCSAVRLVLAESANVRSRFLIPQLARRNGIRHSDAVALNTNTQEAAYNTSIGGQYGAITGFDLRNGEANMVINPNLSVYAGGIGLAGMTGHSLQHPNQQAATSQPPNSGRAGTIGHSPQQSQQVTTPRLPGSGISVPNGTGRAVSVIVAGGQVSAIRVGPSTLGMTQGTFVVPAGQSVAVVYKAAPTWVWQGVA